MDRIRIGCQSTGMRGYRSMWPGLSARFLRAQHPENHLRQAITVSDPIEEAHINTRTIRPR